jgi:hypothetical protein
VTGAPPSRRPPIGLIGRIGLIGFLLISAWPVSGQDVSPAPTGAAGGPATDALERETPTLASEHFTAGNRAFQAGDYQAALAAFEAAIRAGSDGPAVHYNVGVCHYRLGHYAEAEDVFRDLGRRFPEMRYLAEYNLGLALTRRGRLAEASVAFERATAADDERIAALAQAMLARVRPETSEREPAAWTRLLDLRVGHDDNVALIDDSSLPAGRSTDSAFSELVAYLGGPMTPRRRWRLDATAFLVDYADAGQYNQQGLFLDSRYERGAGDWRLSAGPRTGFTTLDGDGFEQYLGVTIDLSRSLTPRMTLGVRLAHDEIDSGASRFAFVEGEREELILRLDRSLQTGRVSIDYRIERNDRVGAGVSADRDRYSIRYRRPFGSAWNGEVLYDYRDSEYERLAAPRTEKRHQTGVLATRALPAGWRLNLQYRYADNDSSDPVFSYERHRVSVGAGKVF